MRRLALTDFRSYEALRLEPGPQPVVLTGANGAGKTNLLEALSYLAPGRGLRGAGLEAVIRVGAGAFAVAATVERGEAAFEIGTGFRRGESGRAVRIDREPARTVSALGEIVRVLWLTPAMDGLFTGPAADRRRFLDRLVLTLDPGHAARVAEFEKLMRQRNRLLEEARPDPRWLDAVERELAGPAVAVAAARAEAVANLSAVLSARAGGVFPDPSLELVGTLEAQLGGSPAVDVEEGYRRALREGRSRDAAAGRTLTGPHRSDLAVIHANRGVPAAIASTGEQKGLLIALVLAHARIVAAADGGIAPVLLLDEVAAHLDDIRRAALFGEILALGAQAWMTGTDRALFTDIAADAQCLEVADGQVSPL